MAWRLPRIKTSDRIVSGENGTPLFVRWWQSLVMQTEDAINNLAAAVDALNGVEGSIGGFQPHDVILDGLSAVDESAGLVEQTGSNDFTKRAIGVTDTSSIPTRADADERYLRQDGTLAASASTTTHKLAVDIGGVTYYILLSNV